MNCFDETSGFSEDGLIGGIWQSLSARNIKTTETVRRGQLLAAADFESEFKAATAADKEKVLVIAAQEFIPDEDHEVTRAYWHGLFNREKIISETPVKEFEQSLRQQGILLTSLKEAES